DRDRTRLRRGRCERIRRSRAAGVPARRVRRSTEVATIRSTEPGAAGKETCKRSDAACTRFPMSALAPFCLVALALAAPAEPPPRLPPQAWPVVVTGGVQALGFHPTPPSPVVAIGTEVGLLARRFYGVHVGLTLGGFR